MKAIVLREPGGPEQLRLEDMPTPEPGPGEVTVALRAAALNRRDIVMRSLPRVASMMPFIPGSDGAGVVSAVGSGVSRVKEGDEVVICPSLYWGIFESHPSEEFQILGGPTNGTYAQFIRVPAENILLKPAHLSLGRPREFVELLAAINSGDIKPVVDTEFPLGEAGGEIVGIVRVRHNIDTEYLANEAGHIGYDVPPSQRWRGYGIACLQAGLARARELGLERVLVCADTDNLASWRTIERCGGILEVERYSPHYQTLFRRYWIDVAH